MSDKEKGLVPKLRLPEFEGEPTWTQRKIGDFLTESRIKGSTGDVAKKLTVKLWGNGVHEKQEVTAGSENTQYFRRKAGQFIYSKLDFLNQAFGIVPPYLNDFESTVDLPCFDASNEIDLRFLLEYVQRKDFYKKYGEMADGGRKAKRIQVDAFLNFPIFLPNIKEQQKIADCLSSLDALIGAQADKVDALKTHKKGLMQRLFPREGETMPRLRFPEFKDRGEWEPKLLGHLCDMKSGKFITASEISEIPTPGLYPCYGGNGLRGYTNSFNQSGRYSLIGRQGALCGNVNLVEGDFYATEHAVVTTPKAGIATGWLFYNLNFLNLNQYATGQAQPGLSVEVLENVECTVPKDENEQQKIADCFSSLDTLITAEADKLDALKAHKKGLMQQLFPSLEHIDE